MSSPPELRGMNIFGFVDFDAEQNRRNKIQAKFEAELGALPDPIVPPTLAAANEKIRRMKAKINPYSTPKDFESAVEYLIMLGARRIRDMMYMAGLKEVYKHVASSDHHDKVRRLAVELVEMLRNRSDSDQQQPVAVGPWELVMEEICSGIAKLEHKAPGVYPEPCIDKLPTDKWPTHIPIISNVVFVSRFSSDEPWGPPISFNLPPWEVIRDEIKECRSWKAAFFSHQNPSTCSDYLGTAPISDNSENASITAPQAAPLSSQDEDSMEIDNISLSNTALAPSSDGDNMQIDSLSSSDTAPSPSYVDEGMEIDSSSSVKPKTAQFGFASTATGLFSNVDTTEMDDSSSAMIIPVSVKPITSTSTSTGSTSSSSSSVWASAQDFINKPSRFTTASSRPFSQSSSSSCPPLSSPKLWSNLQANHGAGPSVTSASNTPITSRTAASNSAISAKPKQAFASFGFSNTSGHLFSDADTSAMDDDASSSTDNSSIYSWYNTPVSSTSSWHNTPVSSSSTSDGEDSVMSDDENMVSIDASHPVDAMEICFEEEDVTHTKSTTATNLSQQEFPTDLAVIRDMQVLGKRKYHSCAPLESRKRMRSSSSSFRPLKPLKKSPTVGEKIKLRSRLSYSIFSAKPKPTSFVPSTQSVHKPMVQRFGAQQFAVNVARYMERFCKIPAERVFRSVLARHG